MTGTTEPTPLQRLTKNCGVQKPDHIYGVLLGMRPIPSRLSQHPYNPWHPDHPAPKFGIYHYEVRWNQPGTRHQLEAYLQYPETAADARFHLAALDEYEALTGSAPERSQTQHGPTDLDV